MNRGIQILGMSANNESVNGAVYSLLKAQIPHLVQVPCAAHTLQLIVKQVLLKNLWAKTLVDRAVLIIKQVNSSKDLRHSLLLDQKKRLNKDQSPKY